MTELTPYDYQVFILYPSGIDPIIIQGYRKISKHNSQRRERFLARLRKRKKLKRR